MRNIYLVKKPWAANVRDAMVDFIDFTKTKYPHVNIMVNEDVIDELNHEIANNNRKVQTIDNTVLYCGDESQLVRKTDLVVSLGGDGTILRAASRFQNVPAPPILSFSLGTLGFLLPFDLSKRATVMDQVMNNESKVMARSRLQCQFGEDLSIREGIKEGAKDTTKDTTKNTTIQPLSRPIAAMNDISLHRGSEPSLISLDISINDEFLTTTTCDGIVCSTPTGSTAYSLSSGGSIIHPLVPCTLLTLISPRSLSFRPLIVPEDSKITIALSPSTRNISIKLAIDGILLPDLKYGQKLVIGNKSDIDNRLYCISNSEDDWTKDINELLGFNKSFKERRW